METDCFSDRNKRLFKFAAMRVPKTINSLKSSLSISNVHVETYSQNIKQITIAKYMKDSKNTQKTDKSEQNNELEEGNDWRGILELWALGKQKSEEYSRLKSKAQASYIRAHNRLCNQSFRLQKTKKHRRTFTSESVPEVENYDNDLLPPKYIQPLISITKKSFWNITQPRFKNFQAQKNNDNNIDSSNIKNKSQTRRTVCFSAIKPDTRKVTRSKTEPDQKKVKQEKLTFLADYDSNRYSKTINSLVKRFRRNLNTQKTLRNKTVELKG